MDVHWPRHLTWRNSHSEILFESAQDTAATVSAVLTAVADGDLTPADAGEISKLVEVYVKAFETAELAERVERLEGCGRNEPARS